MSFPDPLFLSSILSLHSLSSNTAKEVNRVYLLMFIYHNRRANDTSVNFLLWTSIIEPDFRVSLDYRPKSYSLTFSVCYVKIFLAKFDSWLLKFDKSEDTKGVQPFYLQKREYSKGYNRFIEEKKMSLVITFKISPFKN